MTEKITASEFSKRLKQKYPDYAEVDDVELAQAMVKKYPEYKDRVTFERSWGGFGSNILESGKQFAGGIGEMVTHPIDTAAALGKIGLGTIESMVPERFGATGAGYAPYAQAMKDFAVKRYGGLEALEKTAYEDPVGFVTDLSMLLGGGGAALRGLSTAAKAMRLPRAAVALEMAGKAAGTAEKVTDPVRGAVKGTQFLTKSFTVPTGRALTEMLGISAGRVGRKTIQRAVDNASPMLVAQMKKARGAEELLGDVKAGLDEVASYRKSNYQQALANLPDDMQIPLETAEQAMKDALKRYGVEVVPDIPKMPDTPPKASAFANQAEYNKAALAYQQEVTGASDTVREWHRLYGSRKIKPGSLEFKNSSIVRKKDQALLQATIDDIKEWSTRRDDNLSPRRVDVLKQRVGKRYAKTSDAREIITTVRNNIRDTLSETVPGYAEMVGDYEDLSIQIDQARKGLSIGDRSAVEPAIAKITDALAPGKDYRERLVQDLDKFIADKDIIGQIAGHRLSQWSPHKGLGPYGVLGVLWLMSKSLVHPALLLEAAAISPRIVGEAMIGVGKVKRGLQNMPAVGGKLRAVTLPQAAEFDYDPSTKKLVPRNAKD